MITDPSEHNKALGIHWDTNNDNLYVSIPSINDEVPTKRSVASAVARLYDALGWFAPATLQIKILLQELWLLKLGWDDPILTDAAVKWTAWKTQLPLLAAKPIPRCYYSNPNQIRDIQLHGFSDASNKGYGAVVYLRVTYQDASTTVSIVISKTKVAPLKTLSLPRLELCGAVLAAKLLRAVSKDLDITTSAIYAWSDSEITLAWISKSPHKWKTFLANRVTEVQELVPAAQWCYVPSP